MNLFDFLFIQLNLLVFYLFYTFFFAGKGHKKFNRLYLIIAPIISIGLPFVSFHGVGQEGSWATELPLVNTLQSSNLLSEGSVTWEQIGYASVALIFLLLISYQVIRLLSRPKSKYVKSFEGSPVFHLEEDLASHSFFNTIYLNPLQLEDEDTILIHERAHCKELHSVDMIYTALLKAVFWFNPVIYFWEKRVKENHEFLADQYVMSRSIAPVDYGRLLLACTLKIETPQLTNAFNTKSLLHKRIDNLNHTNKYTMKHLIIVPVIAGLAFISSSMNMEIEPVEQAQQTELTTDDNITDPQFPGGQDGLVAYINSEIKYPKSLVDESAEGTVYISFEISDKGKVINAKVLRGSSYEAMDAEALRVVNNMPDWKPAVKDGKTITAEVKLPLKFAI
ncbi:MAG: M56 family metallopeptidase [Crocinitomicaceae bacterium]|nr:M56 family metallopeptidase [Crocinitomicaceae bacterium]